MANNHQGDLKHAFKIVDEVKKIKKDKNIKAAIKLQFRNLDTFIHKSYQNSNLKFVKRFNETRLTEDEFSSLVKYIKKNNILTCATPFDNESIKLVDKFDIDILKIASCSCDDWPLIKDVAKYIERKIIISTGGINIKHLEKLYNLFQNHRRNISFLHCVGDYPTPNKFANIKRITQIQSKFPDIEVGISSHEEPNGKSIVPYAVALGATIIEKHFGLATNKIQLNNYSLNSKQFKCLIEEVNFFLDGYSGVSDTQIESLRSLKRGVYLKKDMKVGESIKLDDLYFAMPLVADQFDASMVDNEWGWVQRKNNVIGKVCIKNIKKDAPLLFKNVGNMSDDKIITRIIKQCRTLLKKAKIKIHENDAVEVSCHYGLKNIFSTGAIIVDKVNRQYCKKLLILLPGQRHPVHFHPQKEETFELLYGDCEILLNNNKIKLEQGLPLLIEKRTPHSFSSVNGAIIEEISTTHIKGDSVYEDPKINKLSLSDRKIKIQLS